MEAYSNDLRRRIFEDCDQGMSTRCVATKYRVSACRMGNGSGDMVREVQRTLPELYSNMRIMSTLGIQPGGGCHYPLTGWAEFARLLQPQIEQDHYGLKPTASITPPNLLHQ